MHCVRGVLWVTNVPYVRRSYRLCGARPNDSARLLFIIAQIARGSGLRVGYGMRNDNVLACFIDDVRETF